MTMYVVFLEVCLGLLQTFILPNSAYGLNIRGPDFMNNVRIRFMPLVSFFILEKAYLTSLAELNYGTNTYLRLLLRFQLSKPRLEKS